MASLGKLLLDWRFRAVERRELPARGRNTFPEQAPIILIGLFASPSGLGRGVRLMWQDLRRRNRQVVAIDVTDLGYKRRRRPLPDGVQGLEALARLAPGPTIIHVNPPVYLDVYLAMPAAFRMNARLVAYWAWELERLPESWKRHAQFCDEIWVPSKFVAAAARQTLPDETRWPIRVVPHAVAADPIGSPVTPERRMNARSRLGLSSQAFIAGYTFAITSNFARKNPVAAVTAFQAAFPLGQTDAGLLLRCKDSHDWPQGLRMLRAAARDDPRIHVVDENVQRLPITDFYDALDLYLSLHRSEGYGLSMAEAADLGIPVIATGWHLPDDIAVRPEVQKVPYTLVPVVDPQHTYAVDGSVWAEPDIGAASELMRRAYAKNVFVSRASGGPCPVE